MHLLIATCPEAQIFQETAHKRLLDRPEEMFSEFYTGPNGQKKRVEIVVPRSAGALIFHLGVPKPIGGRYGTDRDQDMLFMPEWLTGGDDGGQNQETDCYGIVQVGMGEQAMNALTERLYTLMAGGGDMASVAANLKAEFSDAMRIAEVRSRDRVYREIRRINRHYEDQVKRFAENNKGEYQASASEWLCRYALRKEIQQAEEKRKAFMAQLNEPMTSDFLGVQPNA